MAKSSITDVAAIAGVSIATVSRCLNNPDKVSEKSRLKVHEAIVKANYTPNVLAQNFRKGRTNIALVVIPSIGDPFFTEVVRGIRSVAEEKAYSIIISEAQSGSEAGEDLLSMLASKQTDGIILLASTPPFPPDAVTSESGHNKPIVIGCETVSAELSVLPSVHIDNVGAAADATDYLIERGHNRIALVCGQGGSLLTKDREAGYRLALRKAGITLDPELIVSGDLSIEGAIHATRSLMSLRHRPSAIFCTTDEMAMGCLHELKSQGYKVPQDLSVMGFDDTRYAAVTEPPLTTVRQPAYEIGERTMLRLCELIAAGDSVEYLGKTADIVPHRLVIRNSVGPGS